METPKYLCGNNFKALAKYVLDDGMNYYENPDGYENVFFCKTDYVHYFFRTMLPSTDFTLITHNSDLHINNSYIPYLENSRLKCWYAQNVDYVHPKLKSIPIGIANPRWAHGNVDIIREVELMNLPKSNLLYCNFDIATNPPARQECLRATGVPLAPRTDFKNYLMEMKQSYFVLSPNGNGVDCHKTWEALYLKTIPIVTNSVNITNFSNYPMLVLDKWDKFSMIKLSQGLYEEIWKDFDTSQLYLDKFKNSLHL